MQAFARAQQLLSRKEDLAELPPMAPLASMQADGSPKRRSTKPAAAPQPAAARRRPAPQKEFALPADHGPLPSLSQLATESVGQELLFLQKPNPTSRRPLRPRAPPEESRRAALSAIDTAMPSLDDDSAQLIARARALIDGSAGAEGLTQAPGRPGATSSASLQRRQRRPASSARLQTLPERTGPAAASAAGGGAAAAARIRTAPPQSAPAYEPVARYGGADARAAHHEEMRERARERVRQARLANQQQEVEAEMEAVSRQAGALSRDAAKVESFRAEVERRLAAKLREQKRQAQESAREQMEMAAAQRVRQQEQAAQEQAVRRALQRKQQAAQQQGEP